MQTLTLAAVLLSAAALVSPPAATGSSPVAGPHGFLCGYTVMTNPAPWAGEDDKVADIDAGPATTDVPGTLVCTVRIGSNAHDTAGAAVAEFPAVLGVIAGAEVVEYTTSPGTNEYMCTSFRRADGTTIYYTTGSNAGWDTDPAKECVRGGPFTTLDFFELVDGLACPHLAARQGSSDGVTIDHEGDVFVDQDGSGGTTESEAMTEIYWDCPVYVFAINGAVTDEWHDATTNTTSLTPMIID